MTKLAILGASGHGKVVADTALANGWKSVTFFDDAWPDVGRIGAWDLMGGTNELLGCISDFYGVIVGIGNCDIRWKKQQCISNAGGSWTTVIHPMAFVSPYAQLGEGVVVMAGAVVNADANVGDSCIINSGAVVEHDCTLSHAVHVAPGAVLSGNVSVGSCSWIGVGAVVRQGTKIGVGVTVGAGAVVLKQVRDRQTVVGCPAAELSIKI